MRNHRKPLHAAVQQTIPFRPAILADHHQKSSARRERRGCQHFRPPLPGAPSATSSVSGRRVVEVVREDCGMRPEQLKETLSPGRGRLRPRLAHCIVAHPVDEALDCPRRARPRQQDRHPDVERVAEVLQIANDRVLAAQRASAGPARRAQPEPPEDLPAPPGCICRRALRGKRHRRPLEGDWAVSSPPTRKS